MDSDDDMYEVPVPDDVNEYHILVMDEDEAYARSVASILHQASYQVSQIQNPEVALSMIRKQPKLFTVVLLGIPLQAMDPIAFVQNILFYNCDIPVLLMCLMEDLNFTLRALQYGASLVFEKPVKRHSLRSLWQHVERKRYISEKKKETKNVDMGFELANVSNIYSSKNSSIGKRKERDEEFRFGLGGLNSAPFLGLTMGGGGNITCFPGVNLACQTPALSLSTVSSTTGDHNYHGSNVDVNVVADDQESSTNDHDDIMREDHGFTLEELFPELEHGGGAKGRTRFNK